MAHPISIALTLMNDEVMMRVYFCIKCLPTSYMYRDPIEHFIRDGKQEIGLESSQQRGQEAVEKYWELGFNVPIPSGVPTKKLETIGQKCRLMEFEILQLFVERVKAWVLEGWDTKELTANIFSKRLNRLAH